MSWHSIILLIYQIIVVATIIHVVLDNRQPSKTMAWGMVIFFVPVVGIIAYLFLGVNTRRERMVSQRSMDQLTRRSMSGFIEQGDLQLPELSRPVIDLFINASARDHIHIDVYIFEDDALGRLISDALIAKAREGVEVRVLYDAVGCWSVDNRFFERMRIEGVEVEAFMPVRFPTFARKMNYRNHRKIFIVDGRVGYIGGMNFALRYVKGRHQRGWRDTMMRIEGSGVYSLQRAFLIDWYFVDRTQLSDKRYYPKSAEDAHGALLQTVTSAPLAPYPEIMQGYLRIILSAKRYIYIQSPYFLPTETIFFALKTAVASGVDVRVMVPRKTDGWFVEWGSRSYLREAQEAGIQILLYEPRFLHAKTLVCDDHTTTCGSTNIDFRSFLNNFEANTFVYDETVALQMKDIFLRDARQSTPLSSLPKRLHPKFLVRLGESVMRLLSPLL